MTGIGDRRSEEDGDASAGANEQQEAPVDGPGAAEGNDEAGATSYDEPGGQEHGT